MLYESGITGGTNFIVKIVNFVISVSTWRQIRARITEICHSMHCTCLRRFLYSQCVSTLWLSSGRVLMQIRPPGSVRTNGNADYRVCSRRTLFGLDRITNPLSLEMVELLEDSFGYHGYSIGKFPSANSSKIKHLKTEHLKVQAVANLNSWKFEQLKK